MVSLIINGSSQNQTLNGTYSYDSVTITNGGTLFVTGYTGTAPTGTLVLNVSGDVNVDSTSQIIGDARGYRGGAGGSGNSCNIWPYSHGGAGGEGTGGGSAGTDDPQGCSGSGGGGGGSYGSVGGSGGNSYLSRGVGGSPGSTYGNQNGSDNINMGSGAGGGGGSPNNATGQNGNPGGAMLTINANNIYIHGIVSFNGGNGGAATNPGSTGGGGGGGGASGGGILLNSNNIMNLSGSTIRANGGTGGSGSPVGGTAGGSGGGGRIKIFYGTTYTAPTTLSAGTTYVQLLTGSAYFTSTPSGASIYLDGSGTSSGTTPTTIAGLITGGHSYTLKLTSYADVSGSFNVTTGTTNVPVTFAGSASISSTPTGARIYLAVSPGTPSDQGVTTPSTFTGLTAASSGATTVWNYRLTLPSGYADATGSFTATAGSTVSVPVSFPPSASFSSNPANARIWIDGVDKGLNTPNTITGLTAGSRSYTLKLTGYADSSGSFTATAGSTTTVPTVTFAPSAIFATTPSGASIYLDGSGTSSGTTPSTITGLTAGSHTYKLFLAGYNAVTGNFSTVAGTTTTIPTLLLSGTAMAFLSAGD